ncbi:TPA: cysteine hydrolase, partial [Pseudomonas aeruginosa]
MTELVLESPFNSALLLMDFQEFVLNNFVPAPRAAEVVARTSRFLSRVRQTDMLVVHVTVGCPPDGPPMDRRNRLFRELRESGLIEPG